MGREGLVLVFEGARPWPCRLFVQQLRAAGFEVRVRPPGPVPVGGEVGDPREYGAPDAVVLVDVDEGDPGPAVELLRAIRDAARRAGAPGVPRFAFAPPDGPTSGVNEPGVRVLAKGAPVAAAVGQIVAAIAARRARRGRYGYGRA